MLQSYQEYCNQTEAIGHGTQRNLISMNCENIPLLESSHKHEVLTSGISALGDCCQPETEFASRLEDN